MSMASLGVGSSMRRGEIWILSFLFFFFFSGIKRTFPEAVWTLPSNRTLKDPERPWKTLLWHLPRFFFFFLFRLLICLFAALWGECPTIAIPTPQPPTPFSNNIPPVPALGTLLRDHLLSRHNMSTDTSTWYYFYLLYPVFPSDYLFNLLTVYLSL